MALWPNLSNNLDIKSQWMWVITVLRGATGGNWRGGKFTTTHDILLEIKKQENIS